jgi:hypothetical protein
LALSVSAAPKLVSFDRVSNLFYTFITHFQQPRQAWSLKNNSTFVTLRVPHAHNRVEFDRKTESTDE